MRLIIVDDAEEVAMWVATYVKKRILAFAPTPERPFVLGASRQAPAADAAPALRRAAAPRVGEGRADCSISYAMPWLRRVCGVGVGEHRPSTAAPAPLRTLAFARLQACRRAAPRC